MATRLWPTLIEQSHILLRDLAAAVIVCGYGTDPEVFVTL